MEPIIQLNSNAKLSEHLASPSEAALGHSNKLDGSHLSPNFTLGEMTRSNSYPEIYNVPTHEAIANLKRVCEWLEVLRKRYNAPIIINSGYRSKVVNNAAGGVATSNHLTGCAVDIRACGPEQALRYINILLDISDGTNRLFDEMILERQKGIYWVHFAVRPKNNRRKINFILKN